MACTACRRTASNLQVQGSAGSTSLHTSHTSLSRGLTCRCWGGGQGCREPWGVCHSDATATCTLLNTPACSSSRRCSVGHYHVTHTAVTAVRWFLHTWRLLSSSRSQSAAFEMACCHCLLQGLLVHNMPHLMVGVFRSVSGVHHTEHRCRRQWNHVNPAEAELAVCSA
jgi:hypothetical protein